MYKDDGVTFDTYFYVAVACGGAIVLLIIVGIICGIVYCCKKKPEKSNTVMSYNHKPITDNDHSKFTDNSYNMGKKASLPTGRDISPKITKYEN